MRFTKAQIVQIAKTYTSFLPKEFPVDLKKLVKYLDKNVSIFLTEFEDENVSGFCKKIGDTYKININKGQSIRRQRFTIAHKIGHVVFGHIETSKIDYKMRAKEYTEEEKQEEIEANEFAANILMPKTEVKKVRNKFKNEGDLADYFGVSLEAMRIRLFNLGY